jgi:hypothetical protein
MEKNNQMESAFLLHLRGIVSYINEMKINEPGFIYDNLAEYNILNEKVKAMGSDNIEINLVMSFLLSEINLKLQAPTRTEEEESFYRHIVGINSYIRETKQREKGYVFDNVMEVEGLLQVMEQLKTKDKSIIAIMTTITNDISIVIANRKGQVEVEQYKEIITNGFIRKSKY